MKAWLTALLLLFQLQPTLGAAACLGLVRRPAQEDCKMPEHGSAPSHSLSAAVPASAPNCAMATVCAPAHLAIPSFAGQLVRLIPLGAESSLPAINRPTDIASAPPLPPPRV